MKQVPVTQTATVYRRQLHVYMCRFRAVGRDKVPTLAFSMLHYYPAFFQVLVLTPVNVEY